MDNLTPDLESTTVTPIKRQPRGDGQQVPVAQLNEALGDQRNLVFQAMGIVKVVSRLLLSAPGGDDAALWTALDGAHELLSGVADRLESCHTMLAETVRRGNY